MHTHLCHSDIVCEAMEVLYEEQLVSVTKLSLHSLTCTSKVRGGPLQVGVVWLGIANGSEPVSGSLHGRTVSLPCTLFQVGGKTSQVLLQQSQVLLEKEMCWKSKRERKRISKGTGNSKSGGLVNLSFLLSTE